MTYEQRIQILSKEVLTAKDIAALMDIGETKARDVMTYVRSKSDRLKISTVIHLQDYIDAFDLPPDRFILDENWKTYIRKNAETNAAEGGVK